jgi:hypothetical protein
MRTWRSVVNAILGKVPGKTSRPDTASRMAMDADFRRSRTTPGVLPSRERDDRHLFKVFASPRVDPIDELIRIVNQAQERDAEDERRLYPMRGDRPMSFQRRRPDRRS